MSKKTLSYKDFLQPTLSDLPSELYLSNEDGVTDFYLEVLSSKNPKVKRAVTKYSLDERDVYASASEIEDKVDRVIQAQDNLIEPRKELAKAFVVGGNFDDYIEVLENPANCDAVIARAFEIGKYTEKK